MSAPNTNLETQRKRHIGPLVGIALAVGFAAFLFLAYLFFLADEGTPPVEPETQIDGRTGAVIEN
ncbi:MULTISPECIES: hypothetical protein [unclassified Dinoroseobacter]|uniref:hypothetical protein n=1 Tax=unclassified Dinoroseobacter TaxID=2620028 RepID=UPI003C7A7A82